MANWIPRPPGTCCSSPEYERTRIEDEGERYYQFSRCRCCGVRFRDTYRYLGSAVDPATLPPDTG